MFKDLPNRHTIRLREYDYSQSNWYYVTICANERGNLFGDVECPVGARHASPVMKLNEYGHAIRNTWETLSSHHPVELDEFQIMPDHVHMIVIIKQESTGEARLAPTEKLGSIIGSLKSRCSKLIRLEMNNPNYVVWQRNYYEHIIRDEGELTHIRKYIRDNPKNWETDKLFVGARRASPVPNVGADYHLPVPNVGADYHLPVPNVGADYHLPVPNVGARRASPVNI